MKKWAVLAVFLLPSCEAVVPQATANFKLSKSQEALRACILAHPQDATKECESQKTLYEMDLRSYRAAMGQ